MNKMFSTNESVNILSKKDQFKVNITSDLKRNLFSEAMDESISIKDTIDDINKNLILNSMTESGNISQEIYDYKYINLESAVPDIDKLKTFLSDMTTRVYPFGVDNRSKIVISSQEEATEIITNLNNWMDNVNSKSNSIASDLFGGIKLESSNIVTEGYAYFREAFDTIGKINISLNEAEFENIDNTIKFIPSVINSYEEKFNECVKSLDVLKSALQTPLVTADPKLESDIDTKRKELLLETENYADTYMKKATILYAIKADAINNSIHKFDYNSPIKVEESSIAEETEVNAKSEDSNKPSPTKEDFERFIKEATDEYDITQEGFLKWYESQQEAAKDQKTKQEKELPKEIKKDAEGKPPVTTDIEDITDRDDLQCSLSSSKESFASDQIDTGFDAEIAAMESDYSYKEFVNDISSLQEANLPAVQNNVSTTNTNPAPAVTGNATAGAQTPNVANKASELKQKAQQYVQKMIPVIIQKFNNWYNAFIDFTTKIQTKFRASMMNRMNKVNPMLSRDNIANITAKMANMKGTINIPDYVNGMGALFAPKVIPDYSQAIANYGNDQKSLPSIDQIREEIANKISQISKAGITYNPKDSNMTFTKFLLISYLGGNPKEQSLAQSGAKIAAIAASFIKTSNQLNNIITDYTNQTNAVKRSIDSKLTALRQQATQAANNAGGTQESTLEDLKDYIAAYLEDNDNKVIAIDTTAKDVTDDNQKDTSGTTPPPEGTPATATKNPEVQKMKDLTVFSAAYIKVCREVMTAKMTAYELMWAKMYQILFSISSSAANAPANTPQAQQQQVAQPTNQ